MTGLGAYALISSLINLVSNLLPEVKNTFFAPSSSSSAQEPDARVIEADLRRLERMLARIKATLYDAEERNIQDQSVRLWLKEIRELGHEAEYVLEEYMYEVYRAQVEARKASEQNPIKGGHNLTGVNSVQIPYDMVDRIRVIKSRFEEIENDRKALCLREEDAPRRKMMRHTPSPTSPLIEQKSLFGREKEKKKITDLLLIDGEGFSVLPLVGKGGIGKTTVAQLVYNDARVKNSFDMVGWVCVSNDFSFERIIQDAIESITKTGCNIKSSSVLMDELRKIVRGKKIFPVLDDVWNEEKRLWEPLRMTLMQARKATILVTTRNISVARIIQTMEPLQLEYLSYDNCWLLFSHYAIQGNDPSNQEEFVEIGKKIVKKCNGLPLAVKSIASLLGHEKELQSWVEILQSNLWESEAGDEVLAPLQISYERLPFYLKPCLLLCSMFPKDHEYSMNLMSTLWIANGYIEPNGRKPIEEVAAYYTKELYERSFLDHYNIKLDEYCLPTDTTFKLHDMVHDLALLNSANTCCSVGEGEEPFISKEVCHLYSSKESWELHELLSSKSIPFVQTLILRNLWNIGIENQINVNSLLKAEHLRALDLENTYPLPFSFGNMKHLRYLCVDGAIFKRVTPQSIFSCYSLRILIIDLKWYYMELHGIENLINLEIFKLYKRDMSVQLPESVGLLKRLRVLEIMGGTENFELPKCIGNLVELNRLVIRGTNLTELPDSICGLTNLKELIIQTSLKALPKDFGNLTNLEFFFLGNLFCHIPLSCGKLIPSCTLNVYNQMTQPDSCHGAVGWLKEFSDLKGALVISDIRNITSIDDVRNANLISMRNLETLSLIWDKWDFQNSFFFTGIASLWNVLPDDPEVYWSKKGLLGISIGFSKNCKCLRKKGKDILENFQPHRNLKNLHISYYHGWEFPRWMGDPLSCSSLVKFWIKTCPLITSLPLGNVLTLKHLYIDDCSRLLHLKRESLPSLLTHLAIEDCNSLVEVSSPSLLKHLTINGCSSLVKVALSESLVELEISCCDMLESLSTVDLKMQETASESSEFASDYCHFEPSNELKRFPALKNLKIDSCRSLVIRANQLVLEEDCEVYIYCCENLKDWCCEHNYADALFESQEEILPTEIEGAVVDCIKQLYFNIFVLQETSTHFIFIRQ
ncbi:CC-NBS-LRR disease resistance protein [Rhynchospora pubera]|uniref:CC-NBS-LRR disease resistance protein n=1 Tax=Rhynchospora pubera TaxID=906938 RepID=A0AAV8FF39_9POAL|nr:CC-NBS-LRR disease resistance protein [Rhynchospora pubera]